MNRTLIAMVSGLLLAACSGAQHADEHSSTTQSSNPPPDRSTSSDAGATSPGDGSAPAQVTGDYRWPAECTTCNADSDCRVAPISTDPCCPTTNFGAVRAGCEDRGPNTGHPPHDSLRGGEECLNRACPAVEARQPTGVACVQHTCQLRY